MGPLTTILTLPVGGPLSALTWIARQIANAATQQLLDPTRIESALLALERRLEDGQIDEPAFEAAEALLLEELAEISALRAEQVSAQSDDPEAEADANPEPEPKAIPEQPEPVLLETAEWTLA